MIFCIVKHIPFSVNKSNFHLKAGVGFSQIALMKLTLASFILTLSISKSNNLSFLRDFPAIQFSQSGL